MHQIYHATLCWSYCFVADFCSSFWAGSAFILAYYLRSFFALCCSYCFAPLFVSFLGWFLISFLLARFRWCCKDVLPTLWPQQAQGSMQNLKFGWNQNLYMKRNGQHQYCTFLNIHPKMLETNQHLHMKTIRWLALWTTFTRKHKTRGRCWKIYQSYKCC